MPQCSSRVDLHGSPGGEEAGGGAGKQQQRTDGGKCRKVGGFETEDQAAQDFAEEQGQSSADDDAGQACVMPCEATLRRIWPGWAPRAMRMPNS